MPASHPYLPNELVQTVLRYAISVLVFLDPDALITPSSPGLGETLRPEAIDRAEYWSAERIRNICRRVCRSWDYYLQGFAHRFVSLTDVLAGLVSDAVLRHAQRIEIDAKDNHNWRERNKFYSGDEWARHYFPRLRRCNISLEVEIFFYGQPSKPFPAVDPRILVEVMPRLAFLYARSIQGGLAELVGFPRLRHVFAWTLDSNPSGPISMPLLDTLSFSTSNHSTEAALRGRIAQWHMPNLRVLCLWHVNKTITMAALQTVGASLETLGSFYDDSIPVDIGTLCPKLTCVATSIQRKGEYSISEAGCSIHTILLYPERSFLSPETQIFLIAVDWPTVQTVRLGNAWDKFVTKYPDALDRRGSFVDAARLWIEGPIMVEDWLGESLEAMLGRKGLLA